MIAISYRREDSLPIAGRLYDRLQAEFGKRNVFMDFDSIPPGVDFRERIKETIERSNLVIAVIGPHWLGEQRDGSQRIDDPTDFVRLEIDYALKAGIPVIPLLVNSTPMPRPEKMPADIEALAFRNALPLDSGLDFHQHTDRLINGITNIVRIVEPRVERGRTADQYPKAESHQESRRSQRNTIVIVFALLASLALFNFLNRSSTTKESTAGNPPPLNDSAARVTEPTVPSSTSSGFATTTHATPMIGSTPFPSPSILPTEASRDATTSASASQSAVEGRPEKKASQPTSTIPRFFVGTWEGEVNQRSTPAIYGSGSHTIRLVIDESGRGGYGDGTKGKIVEIVSPSSSIRWKWVQTGPRTLSTGISGTGAMTLRVNSDGKSALYENKIAASATSEASAVNIVARGTLYKVK
jgi:hypothetical protein